MTVLAADALGDEVARLRLERETSVVVATHGSADEEALARMLQSGAGYVSLIASRKRAAVVIETLRGQGLAASCLGRLKAPAGLDIGAVTPEEIAVSVLAEIVQNRCALKLESPDDHERPIASPRLESTDPVCGMLVEIASARYRSETSDRAV